MHTMYDHNMWCLVPDNQIIDKYHDALNDELKPDRKRFPKIDVNSEFLRLTMLISKLYPLEWCVPVSVCAIVLET